MRETVVDVGETRNGVDEFRDVMTNYVVLLREIGCACLRRPVARVESRIVEAVHSECWHNYAGIGCDES